MTDLRPCPFCGGEPTLNRCDFCGELVFTIYCDNDDCREVAATDDYETEAEAAAAWNRRAVETCEVKQLDALTQTLSMVNGCAWGECSVCGCLTPDDSCYCVNCGRKVER